MREGDVLDGKYHLIDLLGEGGQGAVWLAEERLRDTPLGHVAVKVLAAGADPKELVTLARLSHRRILRYRTFFEHQGRLCIVTDHAEGGDAARALRLRGGPFSGEETGAYMTGLLEALAYLHGEGVGHRDVKPANLLLVSGEVVLGDVGIARALEGAASRVTTRMTMGYAAPEQFHGRPMLVSDVYGAGVTAFEMLTGELPFTGADAEVMFGHLMREPLIPATLPAAWQAWLRRSLEKDPEKRWSAQGALDALPRPPKVPNGYVFVPPGRFWMGACDDDHEARDNEKPRHEVVLTRGFIIKATPVTQAEWGAFMRRNPSQFAGDDRPVECVSWDDAVAFCAALSNKEGLAAATSYRLPTEAEWEYACRAGTTEARYGSLANIAWFDGNSAGYDHTVGRKAPNAWGLCDMLGNVWEWGGDWYGGYGRGPVSDPTGPAAGTYRIIRGGSWRCSARDARAACRSGGSPSSRHGGLGFRPARSI